MLSLTDGVVLTIYIGIAERLWQQYLPMIDFTKGAMLPLFGAALGVAFMIWGIGLRFLLQNKITQSTSRLLYQLLLYPFAVRFIGHRHEHTDFVS